MLFLLLLQLSSVTVATVCISWFPGTCSHINYKILRLTIWHGCKKDPNLDKPMEIYIL